MLRTGLIAWCLLASTALAQSVIDLKTSVRVAPGANLALRDVATLQGPEALAVAETAVPSSGAAVRVEDVRKALEGKVNWGRVSLRGSTCSIQVAAGTRETQPAKAPAAAQAAAIQPGTVREAIQTRLAQVLKAEPADVRLTFDEADAPLLDTPTTGRTVDIRVTATAERVPMSVALYEGDRLIREKAIRVGARVRRQVHIATAPLRRGETIEPGDFRTEDQWLPPSVRPAALDDITGAAARGRLNPGDVIEVDDVAAAVVVSKGDVVAVRCISGGVIVSTKGRALGPARDGDMVELQAIDSKRRFFARMEGRGRAVVAATPHDDDATPKATEDAR